MNDLKKKKHEQIIKQIYRQMSYYFAEKLRYSSITPNQITLSRIILIFLTSLLILSENYFLHLTAAILLIFFSFLDALDGSLATLKNQFSLLGTWLDPQIDRLGFLVLFITIAYNLSKENEFYIYLTMYVLVIFYFRGLISSDIRTKDKFTKLRDGQIDKKSNILKTNIKKNNLLSLIKLQTAPHTHNVTLYIAIGLIFKIINFIMIFLGFYLTIWYLWQNYKIITKTINLDNQ